MQSNNLSDFLVTEQPNHDAVPDESYDNQDPIGLDCLTDLDTIVMQKMPKKSGIQWVMTDKDDDEIFTIVKKAAGIKGHLFHSFSKVVYDNMDRQVFKIKREGSYITDAPLTILSPNGEVMGYVKPVEGFIGHSFRIKNAEKKTLFRINCPALYQVPVMTDVVHKIYTKNGEKIGKIVKKCGSLKGLLPNSLPKYEVTFPIALDNNQKCLILAAVQIIKKF